MATSFRPSRDSLGAQGQLVVPKRQESPSVPREPRSPCLEVALSREKGAAAEELAMPEGSQVARGKEQVAGRPQGSCRCGEGGGSAGTGPFRRGPGGGLLSSQGQPGTSRKAAATHQLQRAEEDQRTAAGAAAHGESAASPSALPSVLTEQQPLAASGQTPLPPSLPAGRPPPRLVRSPPTPSLCSRVPQPAPQGARGREAGEEEAGGTPREASAAHPPAPLGLGRAGAEGGRVAGREGGREGGARSSPMNGTCEW